MALRTRKKAEGVSSPKDLPPAKTRSVRQPSGKVSKTYRLDAARIEAARRALGAKTATEAIETALDMVLFRHELIEGTRRMFGIHIERSEDDTVDDLGEIHPSDTSR